jgi:hypothetical protein
LATALLAVVPAAASNGFSPRHGHIGGVVPVSGGVQPFVLGSGNLVYHGGPVMHTITDYAIYWAPSGFTFPSGYENLINQYFGDVSADSGKTTNVYGIDTQYSDGSGNIQYSAAFGGSVDDADAYPGNGCPLYTGVTKCLTDAQLQSEIASVVAAQGLPQNGTTQYFLFTPQSVGSCFDSGGSECAYTTYCAYHGEFSSSGEIIYANQPYAHVSGCETGQLPNGNAADDTINVTSHENNEAITDPQLNAWYDNAGFEIGDKCAWIFGTLSGTSGAQWNQTINGDHYILQEEYDNKTRSCLQAPSGGGGGGITVTSVSPSAFAQGASNVKVSIVGTGFASGDTASVSGSGVTVTSTAFKNSTHLQATLAVASNATVGARNVTVTLGSSSGSCTGCFTVDPDPVVTSASPSSGTRGTTNLPVQIFGSNFANGAKVKFGNGITISSTTFVNSGEIDAVISIGAGAMRGVRTITVTNTDKGVGSLAGGFTVN